MGKSAVDKVGTAAAEISNEKVRFSIGAPMKLTVIVQKSILSAPTESSAEAVSPFFAGSQWLAFLFLSGQWSDDAATAATTVLQ